MAFSQLARSGSTARRSVPSAEAWAAARTAGLVEAEAVAQVGAHGLPRQRGQDRRQSVPAAPGDGLGDAIHERQRLQEATHVRRSPRRPAAGVEDGNLRVAQRASGVAGFRVPYNLGTAQQIRQVLPATGARDQRPVDVEEHRSTHHGRRLSATAGGPATSTASTGFCRQARANALSSGRKAGAGQRTCHPIAEALMHVRHLLEHHQER